MSRLFESSGLHFVLVLGASVADDFTADDDDAAAFELLPKKIDFSNEVSLPLKTIQGKKLARVSTPSLFFKSELKRSY